MTDGTCCCDVAGDVERLAACSFNAFRSGILRDNVHQAVRYRGNHPFKIRAVSVSCRVWFAECPVLWWACDVEVERACGHRFAVYSLLYDKHKSWFAWVISSLSGFVYAFGELNNRSLLVHSSSECSCGPGFIMMTPQLFINYKLKSVAHLPWRGMVYKALNTFMDDIFAFIITMPLMHRLACFRDGVFFTHCMSLLSLCHTVAVFCRYRRRILHLLVPAMDLRCGCLTNQRVWRKRRRRQGDGC
jgi:hypothetical protein